MTLISTDSQDYHLTHLASFLRNDILTSARGMVAERHENVRRVV